MSDEAPGSAGQRLEHDHHRIDEGFARFVDSLSGPAVDRGAFDDAAAALRHHIYVEEMYHFPVVRASGLMGPILVMLREHGEIWDLLDQLAAVLDGGREADATALWSQLAGVLEDHNVKEERIVYPAGDAQIPADIAATITDELATGVTPEGWYCEMAGRS
ncbi:MAG: hemerythrin domain-containing protein [Actinomycetales bacterium]|nr:hemerythrin domain-containing protein [Actinomycetales bacterium]